MNKEDIFKEESILLPFTYEASKGFKESTVHWLDNYKYLLEKYKYDQSIIDRVNGFINNYAKMLDFYYQGKHNEAYSKFKDAFDEIIVNPDLLKKKVEETDFYRARIVPSDKMDTCFDNNEMWHIPFSKRGLVKSERFSFPGLPCLYLGASSYVCWVELNRPPYDTVQIAYIVPEGTTRELYFWDISLLPSRFVELIKNQKSPYSVYEYASLYPLIAMCSVKVNNYLDYFKPEYIFPQFLMEYVLEVGESKDIIGLKYASVKMASKYQYERDDWELYTCYVVPSISTYDIESGTDTCSDLFRIENSISAVEQEFLSYGIARETEGIIADARSLYENNHIFTESDMTVSYDSTRFFEIEFFLKIQNEMSI
jgi:hypothetical protein